MSIDKRRDLIKVILDIKESIDVVTLILVICIYCKFLQV